MGGSKIDIEKLVEFGVENVLSLAESNPTTEEFYKHMTKAFSEYLNISETDSRRFYNPFHWHFFCREGYFSTNGNSPVMYLSNKHSFAQICGSEKVESHGDIKLSKKVSEEERLKMIKEILRDYQTYFKSNLERANIFLQ